MSSPSSEIKSGPIFHGENPNLLFMRAGLFPGQGPFSSFKDLVSRVAGAPHHIEAWSDFIKLVEGLSVDTTHYFSVSGKEGTLRIASDRKTVYVGPAEMVDFLADLGEDRQISQPDSPKILQCQAFVHRGISFVPDISTAIFTDPRIAARTSVNHEAAEQHEKAHQNGGGEYPAWRAGEQVLLKNGLQFWLSSIGGDLKNLSPLPSDNPIPISGQSLIEGISFCYPFLTTFEAARDYCRSPENTSGTVAYATSRKSGNSYEPGYLLVNRNGDRLHFTASISKDLAVISYSYLPQRGSPRDTITILELRGPHSHPESLACTTEIFVKALADNFLPTFNDSATTQQKLYELRGSSEIAPFYSLMSCDSPHATTVQFGRFLSSSTILPYMRTVISVPQRGFIVEYRPFPNIRFPNIQRGNEIELHFYEYLGAPCHRIIVQSKTSDSPVSFNSFRENLAKWSGQPWSIMRLFPDDTYSVR